MEIIKQKKAQIMKLIMSFTIIVALFSGCGNASQNDISESTSPISETYETTFEIDEQKIDEENNVEETTIIQENSSKENITTEKKSEEKNSNTFKSKTKCTVKILDVGQGSSTLVTVGKQSMLIDGGDSDKSSYVVSFLKKNKISKLKYVIATHYDSDHLNGVVGALNVFEVNNVICPDYKGDSRVYNSFEKIVKNEKINKISPKVGKTYSLGKAEFTIIAPNSTDYSNVNDYSVGIKFEYGNNSFIVCGDATSLSEQEIVSNGIDINTDVYIVNHHGSGGSSSTDFVNKMNPKYAIISVGENNSYGHPTKQTLEKFINKKIDIFRTDKQGEIIFEMNGKNIKFDKKPYNKLEYGAEANKEQTTTKNDNSSVIDDNLANEESEYILNSSTKKIHKANCSSVKRMSEKNKIYFEGTVKEAEEQGYDKCKICFGH